jgi:hypothetical protein
VIFEDRAAVSFTHRGKEEEEEEEEEKRELKRQLRALNFLHTRLEKKLDLSHKKKKTKLLTQT